MDYQTNVLKNKKNSKITSLKPPIQIIKMECSSEIMKKTKIYRHIRLANNNFQTIENSTIILFNPNKPKIRGSAIVNI